MKLFLLFLFFIFQGNINLLEAFLKSSKSNDHLHLSLQYNIEASESIIKLWPDFIHSRNSLFIECFLLGIAFKAILRVWSDCHETKVPLNTKVIWQRNIQKYDSVNTLEYYILQFLGFVSRSRQKDNITNFATFSYSLTRRDKNFFFCNVIILHMIKSRNTKIMP